MKFKILVGNHHLFELGGSEIFTYNLIAELKRLGHDVYYFTYFKGEVSERIEAMEVDFFDLTRPYTEKFDLALISHQTLFRLKIKAKLVIQTCHGLNHPFEQPSVYADRIVAVSEKLKKNLRLKGYESTLINNGADCERFFCIREINPVLKNVLSLCQNEVLNEQIKKACEVLNLNYSAFSKTNIPVWNLEDKINEADLVFSLGRGAIESMACGRNVFVYDHRIWDRPHGDGLITPENCSLLVQHNFSGSYFNKTFTLDELIGELAKYNEEYGRFNRSFALEHLNIRTKVAEYLNISPLSYLERCKKIVRIVSQFVVNAFDNGKIVRFEEYNEYYRITNSKKVEVCDHITLENISSGKQKVIVKPKFDCNKYELIHGALPLNFKTAWSARIFLKTSFKKAVTIIKKYVCILSVLLFTEQTELLHFI